CMREKRFARKSWTPVDFLKWRATFLACKSPQPNSNLVRPRARGLWGDLVAGDMSRWNGKVVRLFFEISAGWGRLAGEGSRQHGSKRECRWELSVVRIFV